MSKMSSLSVIAAAFAVSGTAMAADYDESVDGDLGDLANPTFISLDIGSNVVSGTVGTGSGLDEDFAAFTVGAGQAISSITLTSFIVANGNTSTGFRLYTDQGDGFFQASSGSITPSSVGTDYLTVWDLSDVGGAAPLGPGTYGVLLAEFTAGQQYSFDITVVPAPTSAALLGLGGLVAARRRR